MITVNVSEAKFTKLLSTVVECSRLTDYHGAHILAAGRAFDWHLYEAACVQSSASVKKMKI